MPFANRILTKLFFYVNFYFNTNLSLQIIMKNTNSQVLRKTFAVRFILARSVLAAILIPALLIGSAFTFGGSKLQAQEVQSIPNGSSKLGFFAGFVYLNGFKVDTTKTVTTTNSTTYTDATTIIYRVTYGTTSSSIDAIGGNTASDPNTLKSIRKLVEANCKTGETSVDSTGDYFFDGVSGVFSSFTIGEKPELNEIEPSGDATVTLSTSAAPFYTGSTGETSHCFSYFSQKTKDFNSSTYEVTPDSIPTQTSVPDAPTAITSSKSDQLSGIGLQFGVRWEKWRASLTHFTGKGGDNKLANTLVMADYFLNEDFFVGGGLASMKLTNSLTSGSATSPALRVGYKRNLTSNLSLNFGLTKYISGVSLNHTATDTVVTPAPAPAPDLVPIDEVKTQTASASATIGAKSVRIPGTYITSAGNTKGNTAEFVYIDQRIIITPTGITICSTCTHRDTRVEATQALSRTVYIDKIQIPAGATETQKTTTTKTAAELKAPLVISISFHLSF